MNRVFSIIVAGMILLAPSLATPAMGQASRAPGQLSPELTNAILGSSRPVQLRSTRPATNRPAARLPSNPATRQTRVRPDQREARQAGGKQISGVTTLRSTRPLPSTQQPTFQPFQLGGGQPISKVGVSRFPNSGLRPNQNGGVPVTTSLVPNLTQDQRARKLELAVQEQRASRESQPHDASSYDGLNPESNSAGQSGAADQPDQPEQQNAADVPNEQNPAPARRVVSTALPANFGANRLVRPTTGIARTGGSSIQGRGVPRRAAGIPRSPKILPAGQGSRSAASRLRGGFAVG